MTGKLLVPLLVGGGLVFLLISSSNAKPAQRTAAGSQALSPELQRLVNDAIANGSAPALTSTAQVLERAGFPQVADELRRRARAALDPTIPPDLAEEVARQLQLQGDPNVLESLAQQMRSRGFSNTADQLEAKARQIRTALDAARSASTANPASKSPGVAQPTF